MKKYKTILNIGYKNEKVIYYQRLTKKRVKELEKCDSYVMLYYDDFFKKYVCYAGKTTEAQKNLFNNNLGYYCN